MDAANLLIGVVLLVFGILGVLYLGLAMVTTPLPRATVDGGEPRAYPSMDRFIVPLMLPVGVALAVAAVIFLFSQILVAAPESIATPIALAIALSILLVGAAVASAPRITRPMVLTAIGVPALALLIAGGLSFAHLHNSVTKQAAVSTPVAAPSGGSAPTGAVAPTGPAGGPGTNLSETTTDNKFSDTSYTVKAGEQVTMVVHNNGTTAHNWHLLNVKSTDGKDIVTNPLLVQPGTTASVTFTIASPGTYKFQCDVHPTEMTGTITVQ